MNTNRPLSGYGTVRPDPAASISPDDPLHLVVLAVESIQKQALKDLGDVVRRLSDDIAATAIASEAASRASAERIIGESAEWAAAKIRVAGEETAGHLNLQLAEVHAALRTKDYLLGGVLATTSLLLVRDTVAVAIMLMRWVWP